MIHDRYYDVVRITPSTGTITTLTSTGTSTSTSTQKRPIESRYGPPEIVRIRGDVVVFYQELYNVPDRGALTVALWRDGFKLDGLDDRDGGDGDGDGDWRFTMDGASLSFNFLLKTLSV